MYIQKGNEDARESAKTSGEKKKDTQIQADCITVVSCMYIQKGGEDV